LIKDLPEGAMLLADKGYDANALRNAVIERKAWANIPPKANRKAPICFSPFLYKARNLVERFFNKAKQFRRIATSRREEPHGSTRIQIASVQRRKKPRGRAFAEPTCFTVMPSLLIRSQAPTGYHLPLFQTIHCGRSR